ncbi:MAG: hypothetical protein Q4C85_09240 [Actinomyces sp.]|uniref:hypothetical protein n=1 Tax=Actinomyces sp. TaxID=29317 RepID=UPI0026DDAC7A|nr:hypothetical protein [Actinomyces sp.]MDO4243921.1 hypothetical protein [Actinomyces sp.]
MSTPLTSDAPLDAATALEAIEDQQATHRSRMEIRSAPILLAWGLAWLVGYTAGRLGLEDNYTVAAPHSLVFIACLVAAGIFTVAYIARRARGLRGRSSRFGATYGMAWCAAFAVAEVLMSRLGSFLDSVGTAQANEMAMIVSNGIPCLIVGSMFMIGGSLSDEPVITATGGWILTVTTVATLVGGSAMWLIMAVAGSSGFFVAAALSTRSESRRAAVVS